MADPIFRHSLTNTLKILFVGGVLTFAIAFALMLVLREMNRKLFARSVLFFPCLVNAMVFGIAAGVLFSPTGPVNKLLEAFGWSRPPQFLATEHLQTMILGTLVWTATGYYTAILMAAVDQIPEYLYEAAELDGADAFQRFRHVTLPMCWDVISVCAVLWTVSSVKIFELILMYGGSSGSQPPSDWWNTAMYVYVEAFPTASTPQLGLATAAALVSLLLVVVFTVVLRRLCAATPSSTDPGAPGKEDEPMTPQTVVPPKALKPARAAGLSKAPHRVGNDARPPACRCGSPPAWCGRWSPPTSR